MNLTPEQKQAVSAWVAAGDSLSVIQKKLSDEFKLSLRYMDVRFVVDDLNLSLKDAAPKADASDVSKGPNGAPAKASPDKKGLLEKSKDRLGLGDDTEPPHAAEDGDLDSEAETLPEGATGNVRVSVDKVTLIPGAIASGAVTFSDGVTAKWVIDHQGRPGLTEVSQPGYRPAPADAQAFMQELSQAIQTRGY